MDDGTADFEYFPSMDGIRWWQYSSNPYEQSIVLLDDEEAGQNGREMILDGEYPDGSYPKEVGKRLMVPGITSTRGYSIASLVEG